MALQSTDPVADLLTRIRNAAMVGKHEITVPTSKLKETVARELKKSGYIKDVKVEQSSPRNTLVVTINNPGENAVFTEIARISKPGRRVYAGVTEIPRIKSGRGIVLVSTSKGVMTGHQAVKERLGGELLCKIY
jgi:small subunit ribosomal protein S8